LSEELNLGGKIDPEKIKEHSDLLFPVKFRDKTLTVFNEKIVGGYSAVFEKGQWLTWNYISNDTIYNCETMEFNFKKNAGCSLRLGFRQDPDTQKAHGDFFIMFHVPQGEKYSRFDKYRREASLESINIVNWRNLYAADEGKDNSIPAFHFKAKDSLKEIQNETDPNKDYHAVARILAERAVKAINDMQANHHTPILDLFQMYSDDQVIADEQAIADGQVAADEASLSADYYIELASKIIEDVKEDSKLFKRKWIYKVAYKKYRCAVFQNCKFEGIKYNFTIDVYAVEEGFQILIFERNGKFDDTFERYLKEILPDYDKAYSRAGNSNRAGYKNAIGPDEYDKLITTLKQIMGHFNAYAEKQKTS
jgi:hypothetical protein